MIEFKVEKQLKLPDHLYDARYHPKNHNLIAASTISGHIYLIESGELGDTLKKHHKGSPIRRIRFTQDGLLVSLARTVKIHNLETKQTLQTISREDCTNKTPFYSLKTFGSFLVAAGDDDGYLMVWDLRSSAGTPLLVAKDCDQYISDIEGNDNGREQVICTSGEGTLTAYDMRARKMIEPQSELFEAGFSCLKKVEVNRKVVVGAEDCALYIFNQDEWGHPSGKFSVKKDARNRSGRSCIDCMEIIELNSTVLVGCQDGRVRCASLWPQKVISETIFCRKFGIESIHLHPNHSEECKFIVCGDKYLDMVHYTQSFDDDHDSDDKHSSNTDDEDTSNEEEEEENEEDEEESNNDVMKGEKQKKDDDCEDNGGGSRKRRWKPDEKDFLNVFS